MLSCKGKLLALLGNLKLVGSFELLAQGFALIRRKVVEELNDKGLVLFKFLAAHLFVEDDVGLSNLDRFLELPSGHQFNFGLL